MQKIWFDEVRKMDCLDGYSGGEIRRRYDRLWTLGQIANVTSSIEGDIAEMGVYTGASAAVMLANSTDSSYFGFDSFQGLSRPEIARDGEYWSAGDLSVPREVALRRLSRWASQVHLIEGWIPDCFSEVVRPVSFRLSHIDVDLYEPTRDSLEWASQRTVEGGLIVCDDYGFATCPGAKRAVDEFVESSERWRLLHLTTGQAILFMRTVGHPER